MGVVRVGDAQVEIVRVTGVGVTHVVVVSQHISFDGMSYDGKGPRVAFVRVPCILQFNRLPKFSLGKNIG